MAPRVSPHLYATCEEPDSPEEAVLVRPRCVCAHSRVGRALIQLEDAGVHGSCDVQGRGAVQVELWASEHVCEKRVRVKKTYRIDYASALSMNLFIRG